MSELNLINKIIILQLLHRADFAMTTAQVSDFLTENNILNYFQSQEVLSSLVDASLLTTSTTNNVTLYRINEKGEETLRLFTDKLTPAIESDIKLYFEKNGLSMKQSNALTADYDRVDGNAFLVHLSMREDERIIIDLSFRVTSASAAEAICTNWKVRYEDVYESMIDKLLV